MNREARKIDRYIDFFTPTWMKEESLKYLSFYRYAPVNFIEFCLSDEYL